MRNEQVMNQKQEQSDEQWLDTWKQKEKIRRQRRFAFPDQKRDQSKRRMKLRPRRSKYRHDEYEAWLD